MATGANIVGALSGLRVIVTRPLAQAVPWAEQLRALGAEVECIPLLEIRPLIDSEQQQAIKNCILELDRYQKIIFVSQNAVEYGCDWIENYWPQLPQGVKFFAVGDTTARQLQARDFPVTDLAQSQTGAMTSEALLQSPGLQSVTGERILIMRGQGGRPQLGQVLAERGAQVDYCELYQRALPESARANFTHQLASADNLPVIITLHSGEALENLQRVAERQSALHHCYLLVPSLRVAELAHAAGLRRIETAQNATDACMLQGLMNLKHKLTLS
jgi:uroporphyrinogen-III synthase